MGHIHNRVKHRGLGWIGTIQASSRDGRVQVQPDHGTTARWFDAAEFDLAPAPPAPAQPWTGIERRRGPRRPVGTLDVRDRYLRDPLFHHLVQTMLTAIQGGVYTPTEVREAAMLAQVIYEEHTLPRPIRLADLGDPRD